METKLASGAFSTIYLGLWENSMVIEKRSPILDSTHRDHFEKEVVALEKLSANKCSCIPQFKSSKETNTHTHIYMEHLEKYVEFRDFLVWNAKYVSFQDRLIIACNILRGIQEIHSLGIALGDLKPENIMISNLKVKFIDFGFSHFDGQKNEYQRVGTSGYMSPEIDRKMDNVIYDFSTWKSADFWAAGMILFELFTADGQDFDYFDRLKDYYYYKYNTFVSRSSTVQSLSPLLLKPFFDFSIDANKSIYTLIEKLLDKNYKSRRIDWKLVELFEEQIKMSNYAF